MSDKIAVIEKQLAEARERLRVVTIENAAAKLNAIKPEQVGFLLDGFIKTDDNGNLFVVNDKGTRRYDRNGAPLAVRAVVAEFLEKNPHMKKTEVKRNGSNPMAD